MRPLENLPKKCYLSSSFFPSPQLYQAYVNQYANPSPSAAGVCIRLVILKANDS